METIVDNLYQRLRQDIVECELTPGKSFSESELGRLYDAGRTPVREACRRLEHDGLMRITPFRGYAIAPLTVREFQDLQEMQLIFEPAAAAFSAERASPQEMQAMQQLAGYVYNVGDKPSYREFVRSNFELHLLIAQSARNARLIDVVGNVHTRLMRFFYLGLAFEAQGPTLAAEHLALVEAIAARDPKAARRRATEHISRAIARSATLLMDAIRFGEAVFEAGPDGTSASVTSAPHKSR